MSAAPRQVPRCLGAVTGGAVGPTVVVIGGIHGNEPAGVLAAHLVLGALRARSAKLRGKAIALSGNRLALQHGLRFLDRDLNRNWDPAALEPLARAPCHALTGEDREQRELHDEIVALERASEGGRLVFLDLHTTSGPTEPFVCFSDTGENRRLACALPVNVVLGLERALHASLLTWVSSRGHTAVSFEAGQHGDPATSCRHIAAVWMLLVASGALDARDVPDEREHVALLTRPAGGSRVVEVRHRHVIHDGDCFEMLDGFGGFDPIEAGQIVARDRHGPIRAPENGLMLMPRYQRQGDDGFFVAREVACDVVRAR